MFSELGSVLICKSFHNITNFLPYCIHFYLLFSWSTLTLYIAYASSIRYVLKIFKTKILKNEEIVYLKWQELNQNFSWKMAFRINKSCFHTWFKLRKINFSGKGHFLMKRPIQFFSLKESLGAIFPNVNHQRGCGSSGSVVISTLSWADTGCFRHRYIDFGHTNLGVYKFSL